MSEELWAELVSWLRAGAEYADMLKPGALEVDGYPDALASWVRAGQSKYLPLLLGKNLERRERRARRERQLGRHMALCRKHGRETEHYGNGQCVECNKARNKARYDETH